MSSSDTKRYIVTGRAHDIARNNYAVKNPHGDNGSTKEKRLGEYRKVFERKS